MNTQSHFDNVKQYLARKWEKSARYKEYIVDLTDEEVRKVKEVAKERLTKHKNIGRRKGNIHRETLGALGEFATIKWFIENGYDASYEKFFQCDVSLNHDDNFDTDFVWNGKDISVEIKATEKPMKSKLIVPEKQFEKKSAEVYVLICQISEKKYCIKGFASSEDLQKDEDLKLPGYSIDEKNLIVSLDDLLKKK